MSERLQLIHMALLKNLRVNESLLKALGAELNGAQGTWAIVRNVEFDRAEQESRDVLHWIEKARQP